MNYDILLVNDDGYLSEGIITIRKVLKDNGYKVLTITPDRNMSGSSHSLTFTRPLRIVKLEDDFFYVEDGTPADCVHLGFNVLLKKKKPKILVSGINTGPNLGDDIFYSGTVGAAREGTLLGIKSIALSPASSNNPNYMDISILSLDIIEKVIKFGIPEKIFFNISFPNIPKEEIKGIKITKQGRGVYDEEIKEHTFAPGYKYYWIGGKENLSAECDEDTDYTAVQDGYISITPITTDLTAYNEFESIKINFLKDF